MRRHFVHAFALLALGAAPLAAETFYVPVVEPLLRDGSRLSTELQTPRSAQVTGEEKGLAVIDTEIASSIQARIKSAQNNRTFHTGVPVISSVNRIAAGKAVYINGLTGDHRDVVSLDLVNLKAAKAQCQIDLVQANGASVATIAPLDVTGLSTQSFENAMGIALPPGTVSLKISCNQDFYAYAVGVDRQTREVSFALPSPTLNPFAWERRYTTPTDRRVIVVTREGQFHFATRSDPKGLIDLPVPGEITLRQVRAEFDVTIGPWSQRQIDGNHGLLWLHRGKFRPHTVANVNAQGPKKNGVKINQNLDLHQIYDVRANAGRFVFERGQTYHINVFYDAPKKSLMLEVSQNGKLLKTLPVEGTAKNGEIPVSDKGLFAEFGHLMDQELPEVGAPGWRFSNFRAEMVEK